MKIPVRTEVEIMQETIKEAARATPRILEAEARIANAKATMWACFAFLVGVFTLFFFISIAIAGIKLAPFLWGL